MTTNAKVAARQAETALELQRTVTEKQETGRTLRKFNVLARRNNDPRLSPTGFKILFALACTLDRDDEVTLNKIARAVGKSRRSVIDGVQELEALRMIRVTRRNRAFSDYEVVGIDDGIPVPFPSADLIASSKSGAGSRTRSKKGAAMTPAETSDKGAVYRTTSSAASRTRSGAGSRTEYIPVATVIDRKSPPSPPKGSSNLAVAGSSGASLDDRASPSTGDDKSIRGPARCVRKAAPYKRIVPVKAEDQDDDNLVTMPKNSPVAIARLQSIAERYGVDYHKTRTLFVRRYTSSGNVHVCDDWEGAFDTFCADAAAREKGPVVNEEGKKPSTNVLAFPSREVENVEAAISPLGDVGDDDLLKVAKRYGLGRFHVDNYREHRTRFAKPISVEDFDGWCDGEVNPPF